MLSFVLSVTRRLPATTAVLFVVLLLLNFSHHPKSGTAQALTSSLVANKEVCIAGGGPCGLFVASLLLQQDPSVKISILEKSPRGGTNVNAFGIGLGGRLLNSLDAVPGLRERVESVGARSMAGSVSSGRPGISIISRADLSEQMTRHLEEKYNDTTRLRIFFEEGCEHVDFENRKVTTTKGRTLEYDLLIAADGVNSIVRKQLVQERGIEEEHYLAPSNWKALRLPPQPDIEATSFKPLRHPFLSGGRVLPRYPEGHILLMFWREQDSDTNNPGGTSSVEDVKAMLTDALQDEKKKEGLLSRAFSRALGMGKDRDTPKQERTIVFDEQALEQFMTTRPGRSHYMKIDRFHDDSVVLLGDAAHGMYSLLGQGCACGLKSAQILSECLLVDDTTTTATDLNSALQVYSKRAVPEGHAITDLNLVAHVMQAGPLVKALASLLTLVQALRGRMLFTRLGPNGVPYEQVLKENRLLIKLSKQQWKKERIALS